MVTVASAPLFLAWMVYVPAASALKVAVSPLAVQLLPSQLQVVSPLGLVTLAVRVTL